MKAWGIENGENLHMLNAAEWMVILNLSPCSSALHAFVFPLKFQIFSCALSKSVFCSPNFYAPYLFVAFRLLWRKQKDFRAQIPGSNQKKKKDMPLTCVSQMLFSLSISLPLSVTAFFLFLQILLSLLSIKYVVLIGDKIRKNKIMNNVRARGLGSLSPSCSRRRNKRSVISREP